MASPLHWNGGRLRIASKTTSDVLFLTPVVLLKAALVLNNRNNYDTLHGR